MATTTRRLQRPGWAQTKPMLFVITLAAIVANFLLLPCFAFVPSYRVETSAIRLQRQRQRHQHLRRQQQQQQSLLLLSNSPFESSSSSSSSDSSSSSSSNSDSDSFAENRSGGVGVGGGGGVYIILSFDGAVADVRLYKSNLAIDAALATWPDELSEHLPLLGDNTPSDREWLTNKLSALAPFVRSETIEDCLGVDSVLMARLILEEQQLDAGRSRGCKGKYASKFHPRSRSSSSNNSESRTKNNNNSNNAAGSRPLTVGEIGANWVEGGCLADALRVRYNVEKRDPLPVIQKKLLQIQQKQQKQEQEEAAAADGRANNGKELKYNPAPMRMYEEGRKLLTRNDVRGKLVLLGHDSHVDMAKEFLHKEGMECVFANSTTDALEYLDTTDGIMSSSSSSSSSCLVVVPPGDKSQSAVVSELVRFIAEQDGVREEEEQQQQQKDEETSTTSTSASSSSSSSSPPRITVLHPSLATLRRAATDIFGDDSPRRTDASGRRLAAAGEKGEVARVALKMTTWGSTAKDNPSALSAAEMSPWLDLEAAGAHLIPIGTFE